MKKAIIHIGPPKTGTTALQRHFNENVDILREAGFFVPSVENPHDIFRMFSEKFNDECSNTLESFTNSSCHTGVFCCEFFSGMNSDEMTSMRNYFLEYVCDEIEVVCYVRHPLSITLSSRQEMLKKGIPLEKFYMKGLAMRYSSLVPRLNNSFKNCKIEFRLFGESNFNIISDFSNYLKLNIFNQEGNTSNPSLSLEAALILDELIQRGIYKKKNTSVIKYLKLLIGNKFTASMMERDDIVSKTRDEIIWIKENLNIDFNESYERQYWYVESDRARILNDPSYAIVKDMLAVEK